MSSLCPACGGDQATLYGRYRDEEYFTSDDVFSYWHCLGCESVFLSPLPVDRLAEIYPANYYSFGPSGGAVVRVKEWLDSAYLARILRSLPGCSLDVLDVGGGVGRQLDLVRSLDSRVSFTQIVDLDPNAGVQAAASGHVYECGRIESFATQRKFHLILLLNLIEHVESPRAVLQKLASLLAPGGKILIKTPNVRALDARIFRRSYWAGLHVPRHWTLFTRASFERLLCKTELRVSEFSYTQGAPFWAASILAAWHRRGWISISHERPAVYHPLFGLIAAFFAGVDFIRGMLVPTSQMRLVLDRRSACDVRKTTERQRK